MKEGKTVFNESGTQLSDLSDLFKISQKALNAYQIIVYDDETRDQNPVFVSQHSKQKRYTFTISKKRIT